MANKEKKILLLAGKWETTAMVYNFLKNDYTISAVVMEDKVPTTEFLKRRAKKSGWFNVAGQVLFQMSIAKMLSSFSRERKKQILSSYMLSTDVIPDNILIPVTSINNNETITLIRQYQPGIIVVHGTRIISKKILQHISCPVLNIHAGITPRYRGSHGAYWALAKKDDKNCGVTLHLVDAGIDTGNIIAQKTIPLTRKDNFATYPLLQLGEGLILLKEALENYFNTGELKTVSNQLNSALWYHPTFWGYLYNRFVKGVK